MESELVKKLTIHEKVKLLSATDWWRTPVVKRDDVFVPHIKMSDGPNGARGESYVSGISAACFPCSTCVGATWDTDFVYRLGKEIAQETKTKSANVLLAPTLNVIRSPLGGRNYETYSEDPYLLGTMGAAFVNGCQSEGIAATPKHFVANDSEKARTKMTSNVDERTLREIYMLPFQIVMRDSDPWCFMTSYNRVNGEYCADSNHLINNVLREEWGFSGAVVSDWLGTYSTSKAVIAGLDLEMPGPTRWRGKELLKELEEGLISEDCIDQSVQRILQLATKTGRFEDPTEQPERSVPTTDRQQFISDLAAEGFVLLKNEHSALPIDTNTRVALIGHHATNPCIGGGGSAKVLAQHIISPLQGLKDAGLEIRYSPGVPVYATVPHALPGTLSTFVDQTSEQSPVLLEWFNGSIIGQNKAHEQMITVPEYMIKEAWPQFLDTEYCTRMAFSLTPSSTGSHWFSVITTGSAIVYVNGSEVYHRPQESDLQPESFYFYKAKIEKRFQLSLHQGEPVRVEIHSWATDPQVLARMAGTMFQGSSLRFTEFTDVPQAIEDAAKVAAESEMAIVCVGNTNEIESEGYDRETMDLTEDQYSLITAVAARNRKTVVVNFSGSPVTLSPFLNEVAGLLQVWFPGQECGRSIAQVILGQVSPSGRLPMSWPKRNGDNPAFGNFPCDDNLVLRYEEGLNVGYRYYDLPKAPEPEFHFGFGLSYTTFTLSALEIGTTQFDSLTTTVGLTCQVENVGQAAGKVVIQIYVASKDGLTDPQPRPLKELKAFKKIALEVGQKKRASLTLDKYAFSHYDTHVGKWKLREGAYTIYGGLSCKELLVQGNIKVTTSQHWTGV
ncbi:hypothetical protein NW762_010355 [Fusarium torreyae]|uniref:beta-glucosidase n=1 Tax=Fusarium torreyae TaxID=1237075 RepID=A0A9W8RS19_9HYPO|nr:hypothetical protein NW762_010355 [Fusarium torreyae]